jgi:hypothetical protein
MKRTQIILFSLLILVSCNPPKNESVFDRIVACKESQIEPDIPKFVNKVTFLPLDSGNGILIGSVDKVAFCNDLIYIADYSTRKIVVYDMNGKFRFVLDRQGRGPGEYLEIKSFTVDSNNLYVLDNFGKKLFVYDSMNGEYKTNKRMPIVAWDVEALSNGDLIFAFVTAGGKLSKKQPLYRLFVTDNDLNIKSQLLDYRNEKDIDVLGYDNYFSAYGDKIIFCSYGIDAYYVLDRNNGEIVMTVEIDFENKASSRDKKDLSLVSNYTHLSSVPIVCGEYLLCDITTKDEGGNYYISGTGTGGFISNPNNGGRNCLLDPVGSYADSFVSVLWDREMYDYIVSTGFQKAEEEVERSLDGGSLVLLFYHMK